ncbi:MAG: hypothetical protein QXQ71_03180 [Desulfurococcaceae archaeon]
MSSGLTTRCLFKNTWYLSSSGFKYGYVFVYGTRIQDDGEGEPDPELELSELVYDFNGDAVIAHGYSLLVDIVEYVVRGLSGIDLSVFTREELRKIAKAGLVNAYMNGITLPVARTNHPEVIVDIARENSFRIGIIADRGTVARNPFIVLLELDGQWVYLDDRKIGEYSTVICKPSEPRNTCILPDARGYGNITTAIEETYTTARDPLLSFRILTNFYRTTGIDNGFVEKGSASDLIIYDLKNPLKTMPLITLEHPYKLLARSQQPDVVFIGGDVFYEQGENLAIPVVKINEIIKKKLRKENSLLNQTELLSKKST